MPHLHQDRYNGEHRKLPRLLLEQYELCNQALRQFAISTRSVSKSSQRATFSLNWPLSSNFLYVRLWRSNMLRNTLKLLAQALHGEQCVLAQGGVSPTLQKPH